MKPLERPVHFALTYVVASVLLGPAIYLGGHVIFTGGVMDYCDSAHGGSARAKFAAAQGFQVAGAVTMLAAGLLLLARLWTAERIGRLRVLASSVGIVLMMCGFAFLIQISGPAGQSCRW
ncbi:hypothetical protein [Nocardia sp. NPDC024068]|uniref:hypothetical protein n=1 Tax=Nocardia sp. NPDC024068 TaxID=3157197 RepID=UPI003406EF76